MPFLEVFDRPLCCSTGCCDPGVDLALIQFAADLDWLGGQGVPVQRYNLAFEPAAFARYDDVKERLRASQGACLPLVRIDDRIVSQGRYPSREELAGWCGIAPKPAAQVQAGCCAPSCCS